MKHFPSHNKGSEPKHGSGHAYGHLSVTSSSSNQGASAYGLSVGKSGRANPDNSASLTNHVLQHSDYNELTGGDANAVHGNSQLGGKHGK